MISLRGMLVEMKDRILWKSKTCQWYLYPPYLVQYDVYILHIVQYIVLSRKIHSLLFYQNICHHHVKFSLKTRIWMSQDFKQFYDNRKIWKFPETAKIDLMTNFGFMKNLSHYIGFWNWPCMFRKKFTCYKD